MFHPHNGILFSSKRMLLLWKELQDKLNGKKKTPRYRYIKQKEIGSEDICTICQEMLLEKKLPFLSSPFAGDVFFS